MGTAYVGIWNNEDECVYNYDRDELSYSQIRDYPYICTYCMTLFDSDSGYEIEDECPNCSKGLLEDAENAVDVWRSREDYD